MSAVVKLRRRASALLLVILAPVAGAAESLTLEQAMALALEQNPALQAVNRNAGIAAGERRQAALLPNPELSWEMEDTRKRTSTTTIQLSQSLELGGKRAARIDLADSEIGMAELASTQQRNQLRAEVIRAYYALAHAQRRVSLAEQAETLARRTAQAAERQVSTGKLAQIAQTRAEVELASARALARRAEQAQRAADIALSSLVGRRVSVPEDVPLLPPPPAESLRARLPSSLQIQLAEQDVSRAEAAMGVVKADRIPDLTVSLGSQYSEETRDRVNVVGFSLPLPLFDRQQGRMLAAAERAEQARDLRREQQRRAEASLEQLLGSWQAADEEAQLYQREILPAAESAVDKAARGLEMGKLDLLDVLDAQRTLIDVRSRYLDALDTAVQARAEATAMLGDLP
ncbi:TolC family protein [Halopseudomonas maritima]|uniref:TolC family protein n=1 Tax=Halopseudomonas maritima TaxID=2918528 RepID=UPI001EEAF07C|nr:TolC family protein [Halopseudomonas maritima]UJJ32955.1 TolC family protein [Halopseudomonas maritima]